jgi:hypothetical protein
MHLVWILPRLLLKFLPKQIHPWFHAASYANICTFISSGCGKHIYTIQNPVFFVFQLATYSAFLLYMKAYIHIILLFYHSSSTRKTGVKVKFKHETDICSAIGVILHIYKCWENSGRKIVVVD